MSRPGMSGSQCHGSSPAFVWPSLLRDASAPGRGADRIGAAVLRRSIAPIHSCWPIGAGRPSHATGLSGPHSLALAGPGSPPLPFASQSSRHAGKSVSAKGCVVLRFGAQQPKTTFHSRSKAMPYQDLLVSSEASNSRLYFRTQAGTRDARRLDTSICPRKPAIQDCASDCLEKNSNRFCSCLVRDTQQDRPHSWFKKGPRSPGPAQARGTKPKPAEAHWLANSSTSSGPLRHSTSPCRNTRAPEAFGELANRSRWRWRW
mmetsp:Transcript_69523/g.181125  ORF Transcript_69523/g.181125 Transcript_69523/m.181125 type:complete len:260 (-) Transcript_69523:299-1078(-)